MLEKSNEWDYLERYTLPDSILRQAQIKGLPSKVQKYLLNYNSWSTTGSVENPNQIQEDEFRRVLSNYKERQAQDRASTKERERKPQERTEKAESAVGGKVMRCHRDADAPGQQKERVQETLKGVVINGAPTVLPKIKEKTSVISTMWKTVS